ncbi:hypothetical protein EJ06DRAFT_558010 [Trichodelitschia bisporula]|uniref:Uncharacterized protein n=1 Tax=Trichodelitschia bisporula TaxID=703511 RepID=A0A6G1HS55_9PEZI|nr:hypothetical protein EJ06DRAFT_558010 [Trichodelitschia bisporula]
MHLSLSLVLPLLLALLTLTNAKTLRKRDMDAGPYEDLLFYYAYKMNWHAANNGGPGLTIAPSCVASGRPCTFLEFLRATAADPTQINMSAGAGTSDPDINDAKLNRYVQPSGKAWAGVYDGAKLHGKYNPAVKGFGQLISLTTDAVQACRVWQKGIDPKSAPAVAMKQAFDQVFPAVRHIYAARMRATWPYRLRIAQREANKLGIKLETTQVGYFDNQYRWEKWNWAKTAKPYATNDPKIRALAKKLRSLESTDFEAKGLTSEESKSRAHSAVLQHASNALQTLDKEC